MIRTAGVWSLADAPVYFIAGTKSNLREVQDYVESMLVAVNELGETDTLLEEVLGRGKRVLLDSGVFALSTTHAKAHDLTMDQALSTPPAEVDGFDALLAKWRRYVDTYGDRLWGYIEIDQGGRENKIKTRTMLEKWGYRPIPVYHPLNDGWDYFDYLAKRYDRICLGNVVMAENADRVRLLTTLWERRRKYPRLWIHALGYTPNQWMHAIPVHSADSSSWVSLQIWPATAGFRQMVDLALFGKVINITGQSGVPKDALDSQVRSARLCAAMAGLEVHNWRNHLNEMRELGMKPYHDS